MPSKQPLDTSGRGPAKRLVAFEGHWDHHPDDEHWAAVRIQQALDSVQEDDVGP